MIAIIQSIIITMSDFESCKKCGSESSFSNPLVKCPDTRCEWNHTGRPKYITCCQKCFDNHLYNAHRCKGCTKSNMKQAEIKYCYYCVLDEKFCNICRAKHLVKYHSSRPLETKEDVREVIILLRKEPNSLLNIFPPNAIEKYLV